MSRVNFESKDTKSMEDGNFFRMTSKDEYARIHVRIDGEGVRPIDFDDATSVIAIVEGESGTSVYFRGNFVPNDPLVIDSPLDWLWHLAHHLTVIKKRICGDESETTYEDTRKTLLTALLAANLMGNEEGGE